MEVQNFKLQLNWQNQVKECSCQWMHVYKVPHLRVEVPRNEKRTGVYIFYEVNEPGKKYFWFPLYGVKEQIAVAINDALINLNENISKVN